MALVSRRTPARALTASALKLTARESSYGKRMSQPWQNRALSYYDTIGEIRFASQFYAKLLSKVRYYPARQLEDGSTEPIESGAPVDILHQIQDPGGGRSRLQYDYGRMMFVTGEGVLFADERQGVQRWRFLWKDEVRQIEQTGQWERITYDKRPFSPPEIGEAYRFWTPHPRHSDMADSPLHSVMDIAEELLILTLAVRATAVSRMTQGVWKMPQELYPSPYTDDQYEGDEDLESNPFLDDWAEHVSATIENPGTADAMVPFFLSGPYEYLDRAVWEKTHDPATDYMERELRKEAVQRLAIGLDFPPEFLLGMTDANHWTARQVVYDMWRSYGTPIAERFADDISDSVLRPMLEDDGYPNWQDVVVAFDDSQVVIPPDRTEDADKALDRVAISFEGYRELKGIPESMAPSEEEREFLASLKMRQPIELEDGNLIIPQRGPVAQQNGNRPEDGPPAPSGGRVVSRQEARTASLAGAVQLALHRCRELAGVRISHRCEECAEGKPLSTVASANPDYLGDALKLVQGGSDGLRSLLCEWGWDDAQSTSLCQQLEIFAARTLDQPQCPDLPPGLIATIEKSKEVSDAMAH